MCWVLPGQRDLFAASDVTPEDHPSSLVHADDVLAGQRPGHGTDGRAEEERQVIKETNSSGQSSVTRGVPQ